MKKNKFIGIAVLAIFVIFMAFSLACASAPEAVKTVDIKSLNAWLLNTSATADCDGDISMVQWKYLVKELSKVDELDNIELAQSKGMTSMNLSSMITVSKINLKYTYSFNNENGKVTLKILNIEEINPTEAPFKVSVPESEFAQYQQNVINKFSKELAEKANQLVEKKLYLE